MLFGSIARDPEPEDAGNHTHCRTEPKSSAPPMRGDDRGQQWWSQPSSGSYPGKDDALDRAALADGNPSSDKLKPDK